ncbi:hypothetical protein [Arthrobacter sp. Edens01]|uniref:hypothetical protein n=1 Tax=Arthrobacter sp. Edens01 TaxID=1732020 RepID=UPI0006DB0A3A|nr:hypothetical protein [Arthrobacter sp. Edens01]KPN17839.1 hypothetical protein AO716_07805 [Arthrobacter sp. Edens01]
MESTPERTAGRRILFLLTALTAFSLFVTACSNAGNEEDTANNATSSAAASTLSSDCQTGPEATSSSCEAAGPGTTVNADRCAAPSPTPLEGGVIEGAFGPWCEGAVATAYPTSDTGALIPEGAETELRITETDMDTTVEMQVQDFAASTAYTGMLHEGPCTENPGELGPQYVHPGSGDNPNATVTLDFTTESDGSADTTVTVPFQVPNQAKGNSIILTDQQMAVVGCVNIP